MEDSPDETMMYIDQNSLYPAQACQNLFPAGKPEIFIGKSLDQIGLLPDMGFVRLSDMRPVMGVIQATVEPPDSLFLPVLPTHMKGKMLFGLCRTCLQEGKERLCSHPVEARLLTDTWTTAELLFALECGYRLKTIHEMVLFPEAKPLFKSFYTMLAR